MFAVGQRWISETETELGLGMVVECQNRFVTITFPASDEERRYTTENAPLTRIVFAVNDLITSSQGWTMRVNDVSIEHQVIHYHGIHSDTGEQLTLSEVLLDHNFTLNQPKQRLLAGQYDPPKLFALRHQCIKARHQHNSSKLLGFVGARADLIPHQLHIASEVGQRFAPRVLLADEVGLGKTIEAALIAHQQLQSGRASRVLIIVPPSLIHQWLVEMLRRVNLSFAIFDQGRYQAAQHEGNPFESEQLVLCSLDFITQSTEAQKDLQQAGWDLLIVDEAHHLQWSKQQPSAEYLTIESLANCIPGVLLLTATPDQLGHESHFARLRLLDPERFHSYSEFLEQEEHYAEIAELIDPLLDNTALSSAQQQLLTQRLGAETVSHALATGTTEHYQSLVQQLLDRHGTGRLLFRNSRKTVKGFKTRIMHDYPLPLPAQYQAQLTDPEYSIEQRLHPEYQHQDWTDFDPRIDWLNQQLKILKGKKVLVICAHADTAGAISEAIRIKSGIRTTVFHEGMSILERDQAASYFAEQEYGAQALICSEIGSEGRNFQFSHHLVLFDLPINPDLLEQRIGRLDRIGQQHDINIHVPVFTDSPMQRLATWYHQGLNSFEKTCPSGRYVYQKVAAELESVLMQQGNQSAFEQLIETTHSLHQQANLQMEQGRDKLLELNSSGGDSISPLISAIQQQDNDHQLLDFMTVLFDGLGIIQDEKDDTSFILRPSENMQTVVPGLNEEGMTVTYDRATALQLEHIDFLSWDHPLVNHSIDTVLTDTRGKSALAMTVNKGRPAGAFWLEFLFVLRAPRNKHLPTQRYFSETPIHFVLDSQFSPVKAIFDELKPMKKQMGRNVIKALNKTIEQGCQRAEQLIQAQVDGIKQKHQVKMQQQLDNELSRLQALQQVNPSIRDSELQHLSEMKQALTTAIDQAKLSMESVQLIVNTH